MAKKRKAPPDEATKRAASQLANGPIQRTLAALLTVLRGQAVTETSLFEVMRELHAVLASEPNELTAAMCDLLDDVWNAVRAAGGDGDVDLERLGKDAHRHMARIVSELTSLDPNAMGRGHGFVWLAMLDVEAPLGDMFSIITG